MELQHRGTKLNKSKTSRIKLDGNESSRIKLDGSESMRIKTEWNCNIEGQN